MDIPLSQYFTSGFGLITSLIAIIGVWFKLQAKVERLEDDRIENKRHIEAFWKWKDAHEKDFVATREMFNKEISEFRGSLLVTNEQYKQIMNALDDIKEELAELKKTRG